MKNLRMIRQLNNSEFAKYFSDYRKDWKADHLLDIVGLPKDTPNIYSEYKDEDSYEERYGVSYTANWHDPETSEYPRVGSVWEYVSKNGNLKYSIIIDSWIDEGFTEHTLEILPLNIKTQVSCKQSN